MLKRIRSEGAARLDVLIPVFAVAAALLVLILAAMAFWGPSDPPAQPAALIPDRAEADIAQSAPWLKTFGTEQVERANAALILPDDRFLFAGSAYLPGMPLAKGALYITHEDGTLIDQRMLTGSGDDEILALAAGDEGGVFAAGRFNYAFGIAHLLETGEPVWRKTFAQDTTSVAYDLVRAETGRLLVAGASNGGAAGLLLVLDEQGELISERQFGGGPLYSVIEDGAGGALLAGQDQNGGALYRVDTAGEIIWALGSGRLPADRMDALLALPDGQFLASGTRRSARGDIAGSLVIKMTGEGDIIWQREFSDVQVNALGENDGGILLVGHGLAGDHDGSRSGTLNIQMWLAHLSLAGDESGQGFFGGSKFETLQDVQPMPGGGALLVGYTFSEGEGQSDIWAARLDSDLKLPERAGLEGWQSADAKEGKTVEITSNTPPAALSEQPTYSPESTETAAPAPIPEPTLSNEPSVEPPLVPVDDPVISDALPELYRCRLSCQTANAARVPYPVELDFPGSYGALADVVAEAIIAHSDACVSSGGEIRLGQGDPVCRKVR